MKKLVIVLGMLISLSSFASKRIVLTNRNTVVLDTQFNEESTGEVVQQAKALDSKLISRAFKEPIYLVLRTPGGDVDAGMAMIDALKGLSRPVDTITLFSASMGFQTVQGLRNRYITSSGVLMSHRARGSVQGEMGGASPSQIQSRLNFYLRSLQDMDELTVKRTKGKQTLESYQKAYISELWIMGKNAVEQGYADEVITLACDSSLDGVTTKTVNFMGMDIQYDIDKCPLSSAPKNIRAIVTTQYGQVPHTEFVAAGGTFGESCPVGGKPCSLDPTLTLTRIDATIKEFKNRDRENMHITLKE